MEEFEVHLILKNGKEYKFFKDAVSKEQIIDEITNTYGNGWYHFLYEYVGYRILKSEIIGIGISLTKEELDEHMN